ncbi:MAG: hypothetical protein IJJ81_06060 [Ruminococcus sp.]|uniref:hypothetical protein n=1 Tax=Ruminococcus flavefaciens TaxID=1265 RepID=UPI0026F27932|nr:hypothetical protein [Ruminococcus flavefaciens]MBR0512114.1 hypothetical protein [Ruminococcus sp.]
MPAYFSLIMEFSRAELDFDNMKELTAYIKHAGLEFRSGAYNAENESMEDIMDWNQKKLEEDFELGYDEDASNDYKQMYFNYGGFSEVRGFIMNEEPIRGEYIFTLLIPQEEVHVEGDTYKKEAVEKLKAIASKLWILPKTRTMQTELELGEGITPEMDIKEGAAPIACPFAIVSEKQFGRMDTADYTAEHIEYGGVILTPKRVKLV